MSNEPVAWMNPDYTDPRRRLETDFHFVSPESGPPDEDWVPLYTQDDTALLRQALEALNSVEWHGGGGCYIVDAEVVGDAIEDLRERLGEKV